MGAEWCLHDQVLFSLAKETHGIENRGVAAISLQVLCDGGSERVDGDTGDFVVGVW